MHEQKNYYIEQADLGRKTFISHFDHIYIYNANGEAPLKKGGVFNKRCRQCPCLLILFKNKNKNKNARGRTNSMPLTYDDLIAM